MDRSEHLHWQVLELFQSGSPSPGGLKPGPSFLSALLMNKTCKESWSFRFPWLLTASLGCGHKMWNASRFCVSSLRRGHANLLCIVPILVYVLAKQVLWQSSMLAIFKRKLKIQKFDQFVE